MPIGNITQTISELPASGRRGVDVQTQFVIKQENFQDHLQGTTVTELNTLTGQLNSRIGEINSTATTMNEYATSASSSATTATTKAGEASTSATAALNSKNQASTFATNSSNSATKASQWADNTYNVAVEAGKYSAKHWATEAQNATANKVDMVTSTDNAIVRFDGTTGAVQNSGVIVDDRGNIGVGVTPSAWTIGKAIDIGYSGSLFGDGINYIWECGIVQNGYQSAANEWKYRASQYAAMYRISGSAHIWGRAAQGTAGNPITWTTAMTLDDSGNLLVGTTTGSANVIQKATVEDGAILYLYGGNATYSAVFTRADGGGHNVAAVALRILKNSSTDRSINTAGTINASGADYAEYEYSNYITIAKGQIVGFKADGTLTDKYAEAIRFAIKSTNPSIVGGDTWGVEDVVGKRPEQPVRKVDKTEQVKIEDSEEFETVVIEAGDTDAEWEAIEAKYKADLADFEARLEAERQKVDRIAYAGKVPVNVYGATAGQYIVAIEKDSGIDGIAVNKADMTFAQYQDAVGRVNKILDDGRAEVAVIIH